MLIDKLSKKELKDLLVKNWMSHDGAWFLSSYLRLGIKNANKLNKSAIKTLAPFEIKRIKKLCGHGDREIKDFEELMTFMNNALSVLKGDFMDLELSPSDEDQFRWEAGKCFAYEGMKRLGVEKEYECGVLYRISRWLKELGIKHKFDPKIQKCLLNSQEKCSGNISVYFP